MADLDVATRSVTAEKPPSIEPSHTSTAPSTLPSTNPNLGSRSSPPAPSRAAEKMVTSINTTAPTSNASAQHQLNHPALPSPASDEPDVHPSPSLSNTELVGCASPEIDAELAELKPQTKSELPPERLSDHSEKEPEQTTPGKASPSIDERALSPAVANTASESPQQQPRTVATRQTNGKKQHAAAESRFGESGAPAQLAADTPDFESPQDEIVVDTTGTAASPAAQEDESMTDAMASPVSHYPKRKRNSVFPDLSENRLDQAMASSRDPTPSIGPAKAVTSAAPKPGRVSVGDSKGVLVGWWRNSLVPDDGKKHAVIAFIDVRDRLRTRIQSVDRDGNAIPDIYALDPGPGNCWVTFDKVAFSDHLVGLDSFAVKEYVRLRAAQRDDSDEDRTKNEENAAAVALEKAKAFYDANERSDLPAKATQIAYGAQIPEAQTSSTRTESKRRKISGIFTSETPTSTRRDRTSGATERLTDSNKTSVALDPLYGTRPTSILLGHWRHSQKDGEPCGPDESHAIYGILGVNDMFRVKMLRETKSGVPFVGNFPQGAGSLWVNYDEVEFEDHLKGLTRNDIKEYCRVRQFQIDQGEEPEDKTANETRAVLDGQARAAIMYASKGLVSGALHNESAPEDILEDNDQPLSPSMPSTRSSRRHEFRRESKSAQHTHTHPEPEATPRVLRRHQGEGGQARFSSMSEREISRGEAHQTRLGRHAATRERAALAAAAEAEAEVANATANAAASSSRDSTEHGASRLGASAQIARLNGSWARREAQRLRSGADDAKVYDGIKYEWRTAGPFVGKLVSHGTLINIDGEDYVEYRILTKPSFF